MKIQNMKFPCMKVWKYEINMHENDISMPRIFHAWQFSYCLQHAHNLRLVDTASYTVPLVHDTIS